MHVYAARRKSIPKGVEYEGDCRALGQIGLFRGKSAGRIPAASHHPCTHVSCLVYKRVCPSNMKYSQEDGTLTPTLEHTIKTQISKHRAIANFQDTENAVNLALV